MSSEPKGYWPWNALADTVYLTVDLVVEPFRITERIVRHLTRKKPVTTAQLEQDTHNIVDKLKPHKLAKDDPLHPENYAASLLINIMRDYEAPFELYRALAEAIHPLIEQERFLEVPVPTPSDDIVEQAKYRDELRAVITKHRNFIETQRAFEDAITESMTAFLKALPPAAFSEQGNTTIALEDLIDNAPQLLWDIVSPFYTNDILQRHLFKQLTEQIDENVRKQKDVLPQDAQGTTTELFNRYLYGTSLRKITGAQIPFAIPNAIRPFHTFCCAGTGHGKTMLLGADLYHNLQREDKPTCIVIDSQDDLIPRLERLKITQDRVVILDPRDAPALNMFALPRRFDTYTLEQREQLEREIADMYGFIFTAKENPLTDRQQTALSYVVKLMFRIPGANIHTLREFIDLDAKSLNKTIYPKYIRQMPENSQAFFENQFFTGNYTITRQGISGRLHSILQNPAFERMFGATDNKLDLFKEIEAGKCILVNTTKTYLGASASTVFGRWVLTCAIACAFQRKDVPKPYRQVLIYVDEAKEYYEYGGETLDDLFTQVRKWEYCMWINTQQTDQLGKAKSTVLSNTAIKFAGGLSVADAKTLAPEMRTTAETLLSLKRKKLSSQFACYINGHTPRAVTVEVPFLVIENAPKMSAEEHKALRQRNRERYGTREGPSKPEPSRDVVPSPVQSDNPPIITPKGPQSEPSERVTIATPQPRDSGKPIIQPSTKQTPPDTPPDDFDPTKPARK